MCRIIDTIAHVTDNGMCDCWPKGLAQSKSTLEVLLPGGIQQWLRAERGRSSEIHRWYGIPPWPSVSSSASRAKSRSSRVVHVALAS